MDAEQAGRRGTTNAAPPPFVRVAPSLFLGSAKAAAAPDLLERAGVTLCVNVSRQQPGPRAPGVTELRVPVFDDPAEDLLVHLEPTCAAMEAAVRAGGACLVYCKNGRSRSAAVCTAYLMRHRGLTRERAFQVGRDFLVAGLPAGRGGAFWEGRGPRQGRGPARGGGASRRARSLGRGLRALGMAAELAAGAARCLAKASRLQTVKSARPVAEPNPGFWSQLQKYEEALQSSRLPGEPSGPTEP